MKKPGQSDDITKATRICCLSTSGEMIRRIAATFFLIVADQTTKALAVAFLESGHTVSLLGSWVGMTLCRNTAFIYGFGSDLPMIRSLTAIATIMVLALLIWLYRVKLRERADPFWTASFMVLIVAGVTGNLLDRLVLGYVRDFLKLRWIGTVNLADIYSAMSLAALAAALGRKRGGKARRRK